MKANKYISKREHKFLLITAFMAFMFTLSVVSFQVVKSYTDTVVESQKERKNQANSEKTIRFSNHGMNYNFPLFHFLTFFVFALLLITKRFLLSSFLTVCYAVLFIYGLSARYKGARLGGEEFSPKVDFLDQVYRAADSLDYIAAFFISILLFWQISILLRMLIKTLQKDEALP